MANKSTRSGKLDIRLSPEAKSLLQQAAEDALKVRSVIQLDAEQWAAFIAALDAPPRRHPRLERLLKVPSVFD